MKRNVLLVFVFLISFSAYLFSVMPSIGGGDSAELIAAASTLGIAHSPGYPLYALSGKLFSGIMPWANPAYKMNVFSAFTASVTVVIICMILMQLLKQNLLPVVLSLFFAFLPGFWLAAHKAEVFALNGIAASIIVGLMVLPISPHKRIVDRLLLLVLGISLGNQHTLILFFPAVLIWVVSRIYMLNPQDLKKSFVREIPILLFFFFLGVLLYAFLPIRSSVQPLLDWEDPETWQRFWFTVRRMRYGSFQLAQGNPQSMTIARFFIQIMFFCKLLAGSLGLIGFSMLIIGIIRSVIKYKDRGNIILLTAFAASGPGIFLLANVMPSESTVYIMNRFMLLPLIPSLLLIAKAAEFFLKKRNPVVLPVISVLFVCVLIPMRVYASIKMGALQRDNYFLIDFGRNVLKHLPPGTLLFSDRADELEFSLAYLLYAEHRRSDVRFIDCNAGVSRSIYGHDYYGIWGKPRLRIREKIEKELIARWKGPVMYGTMDTKQIDVPMTQNGFLYNVPHTVIDQAPVPWDEFLINERGNVNHEKRLQHLFYSSASLLAQYFLDNNMINAGDKKIALLKAYAGWKHWGIMAGYWYYERKMYSKADAEYQSILVKDEDPAVLVYLGSLYNEWQKFDRAEEVLKRSIYLDPAQGQAHYNLAVVYWHKKKWQESAEEFNKTIALEPDNTQAKKFYHKALERYKKK